MKNGKVEEYRLTLDITNEVAGLLKLLLGEQYTRQHQVPIAVPL